MDPNHHFRAATRNERLFKSYAKRNSNGTGSGYWNKRYHVSGHWDYRGHFTNIIYYPKNGNNRRTFITRLFGRGYRYPRAAPATDSHARHRTNCGVDYRIYPLP